MPLCDGVLLRLGTDSESSISVTLIGGCRPVSGAKGSPEPAIGAREEVRDLSIACGSFTLAVPPAKAVDACAGRPGNLVFFVAPPTRREEHRVLAPTPGCARRWCLP